MLSHLFFFVCFFLLFFASNVVAVSELRVVQPLSLVTAINNLNTQIHRPASSNGNILEVPALFGAADYGATLSHRILISYPYDACTSINKTATGIIPSNPNDPSSIIPFFLLMERTSSTGTVPTDCKFVNKVLRAQEVGAAGVIMVNDRTHPDALVYMADLTGEGKSIVIPSMFILKSYGDAIKSSISNNKPGSSDVILSMSFNVPAPDNRVEWELWTSAYDTDHQSIQFKSQYGLAIEQFSYHSLFTPHYRLFYDWETLIICGDEDTDPTCNNQCTNDGYQGLKYCYPNPDQSIMPGVKGIDIIKETVRQLCIYNIELNTPNYTTPGLIWFNYVKQFQEQCINKTQSTKTNYYTADCSYSVLDNLYKTNQSIINTQQLKSCEASNDINQNDKGLLVDERKAGNYKNIYHIPIMFINEDLYSGGISCVTNPINSVCSVIDMICNGFISGSQPAVCTSSPQCSFGIFMDSCGKCYSVDDKRFNSTCLGCDGVVNSGKIVDACGVCGGSTSGGCLKKGTITGIIIGLIFGLTFIGLIAWYCVRRQRLSMKRDVDALLSTYIPLAENGDGLAGPASNPNFGIVPKGGPQFNFANDRSLNRLHHDNSDKQNLVNIQDDL